MKNIVLAIVGLLLASILQPSAVCAKDTMTFTHVSRINSNSPIDGFIYADGPITADTPDDFRKFIQDGGYGGQVLLNSSGGNLIAGIVLGQIIRAEGFSTFVGNWLPKGARQGRIPPTSCYSACAYAFLGGRLRRATSGAQIGFHQFFVSEEAAQNSLQPKGVALVVSETQQLTGLLISYVAAMGVDARIFVHATEAEKQEMFIPNATQLADYNVITPAGFSDFKLEPVGRGVVATSHRLAPTERYDEVLQMSAYCRKGRPYFSLHGNKHTDVVDVVGNIDASVVLKSGQTSQRYTVKPANIAYSSSADDQVLRIEAALDPGLTRRLLDAEVVELVSHIPTAWGGPYPFERQLTTQDRKMLSAAFRLCVQ